jgi:hypothetical protein
MRLTQPLTADESRIDLALRKQYRKHADQDRALTLFRMARKTSDQSMLERVADLLLEKS